MSWLKKQSAIAEKRSAHYGDVSAIGVNGTRLLTAGGRGDFRLCLWKLEDISLVAQRSDLYAPVVSIVSGPSFALTGSEDGRIIRWANWVCSRYQVNGLC
jgi:hypothetical protein